MIADLKPYPEYKESGLPWLGQVPAHWDMPRQMRSYREAENARGERHRIHDSLADSSDMGVVRDDRD